MIVITGTQRSGTSIIAKFFHEIGYDFGSNLNFDTEITGGKFDNMSIDNFFSEWIGDPEFSFKDKHKINKSNYQKESTIFPNCEICKLAYLLQNPVFIFAWHKFRGNHDKFIVLNRDKHNVEMSKRKNWHRFSNDSILLNQEESELKINFYKSLQVMQKLNMQFVCLEMPFVFNKGKYYYFQKQMKKLNIHLNNKEHENMWYSLIDLKKVSKHQLFFI